jgi:BNR repeat-like domain/Carbohydrate esterase, sialic acid-specific acetylesterase/GDSL-like Lipase/Acylhydrolase family/Concanavalin A-like lectin/glucanases superfamily
MFRLSLVARLIALSTACVGLADAAHYRLFVLTGQSNSLGTTNGGESDVSPGSDAADARVKFFWANVADAGTPIGSSGGVFTTLQAQQGGHYPGSATHWGPEIGFARSLVRAGVRDIAIVKASRGGGGNSHWSKAAGGHMYAQVVSTVTAAVAALAADGHTCEIAGLLYLQGESDSAAEAEIAGTRLKELADNLRADLPNAANLRTVIGGIAAAGAARDVVRARHEAIAASDARIEFFPNVDLRAAVTDGLHFDQAAKLRIGRRFAQAFFANGTVSRHYGRLVFLGDSITQGGNGDHPGYRYQVFKRLAEAGVPIDAAAGYKFTGSVTGPQTTPVLTTPDVNGQAFENVHEGHYGWRASWICGRVALPASRRGNNRGEGTLLNWTGQANPQTYRISAPDTSVPYPDPAASGTGNTGSTYVPDTVSILIGVNDLADDNNSASQVIADIGTMVDQLRAANPAVRVFLQKILPTQQTAAMRAAIDAANAQLDALAATKNTAAPASPVWVIDAAAGFDPVTMTYDNIHPNAAGEQWVGDRVAEALGLIEVALPSVAAPPPHAELESGGFDSRFEGNQIWDGTALVGGWQQTGTLTRSLAAPSDLRLVHPAGDGRWIEGTQAGWSAIAAGSWTLEARLRFEANPNGIVLWCGAGSRRILIEIHGDRTQDHADGGQSFNVAHNNLDGAFHVYRVAHDAANGRYHVWRDGTRLSPLAGAAYDQSAADNRLILGDSTSAAFGNLFDFTLDHLRFTVGAFLPPGADADANGLPDAWEYQYFSTLTGTSPTGDPDEDGRGNLDEYRAGGNPVVADSNASLKTLPVFLVTGGANARGSPGTTVASALPPGGHPADLAAGVRVFHENAWTHLAAAAPRGVETALARLLWDAGLREFGIVASTRTTGGNALWEKGSANDGAYRELLAAGTAAAATPPAGYDAVTFSALLHLQGETNTTTEADLAGSRLATLLDNLRADLPRASAMLAVIGEIPGTGTTRDTTRARHLALATARTDIGIARATGLSTHDADGILYSADSLALLGARLAAEVIAMNALGKQPLPAWADLHAWYIADHATTVDSSGGVTRWAAVHDGSANRDLARRVGGTPLRNPVSARGAARQVMHFDGTNDLWANATTEFGAISGPRSVAILCRLRSGNDGYLFDGSTNTGRTRAQVRGGSWQAGVTPAGSSIAWNLADPSTTTATSSVWQRHVFTFTPNGSNTSTTVQHWINGSLAATTSENEVAALGGLMLGSNGGSPFGRLPVEIAELAVYRRALAAAEIAQLDQGWDMTWGTPSGPAFSARVAQTARTVPRFGSHSVLEIPLTADAAGTITVDTLDLTLRESQPGTVARWRIHAGATFDPSSAPLAEIAGGTTRWSAPVGLRLAEGVNRLYLAAEPERHATLGATLDAAVESIRFSGAPETTLVPTQPDPAGELTLALVPLLTDVVRSGQNGINTFRIPGIVSDNDGILHAVYDHRYNGSGDLPANVDVGYARSTDGGASWSPTRVIMDYDASVAGSSGNGVGDPCILHDPVTDTLWVAALWSFGDNAYNGSSAGTDPSVSGQYVLAKSTDGGLTWSAPINITAAVKDDVNWRLVFQGPGHGIALRDGTLVFPSQYRDSTGTVRACSVFSTDHGATWDFGSGVPVSSPQTNENTACELDDGRLLFSMRTPAGSNGQRAWIHYTPGGATRMRNGSWGSLYRLAEVPDPVCQGSVIQWTSKHRGDPREWVLFGNPASSSARTNFTLRVSPDGGATWPVSRLLYAGSSAYSSICILPDRSIGVLLERDNYTKITFIRVEQDWLMNPDADADNDGMPDAWETLHSLDPRVADGSLDRDADGIANAAEHAAGTDPANAASGLRALSLGRSADGVEFAWQAVPGRSYRVEASPDLQSWSDVATVRAETTRGTHRITAADQAPRRFYRARALR